MASKGKKLAAALAAVELYLQEEQAALSQLAAVQTVAPVEPGQWSMSGRVDMMNGRRMIQMRAFARS